MRRLDFSTFGRRLALAALTTAAFGCGAGNDGAGGSTTNAGGTNATTGGAAQGGQPGTGGDGAVGGGFAVGGSGGAGGGDIICTPGGPDDDVDLDGYTPNTGDCEDCDPNRNPNAIEVATEDGDPAFDENCDGEIDEAPPPPCDDGIAIDEMDPLLAASAVELCKLSVGDGDWGVVSAKWVMPDGQDPPATGVAAQRYHLGHGFLDDFGPNVDLRAGERMLVLSSGSARRIDDPGYQNVSGFDKQIFSAPPDAVPLSSPACPGVTTGEVRDPAAVELSIRTPSNATGVSFDFNFFTYEWPGFICSQYNDYFWAILSPFPPGQTHGNISYDGDGNAVSVNNALLEVCGCDGNPPGTCSAGGKIFTCSLGNIPLVGTGFGFDTAFGQDHGSTSWLRTTAPVPKNELISLRFAVHDSGDGSLDSTTLIDNFQWIARPGTMVGTNPVPE
jgi:hypothetical protein